nr:MAG TPA: hypothetical protein [Caudoviricetes sp.]
MRQQRNRPPYPSTLGPLRLPRRRFYPWYFFPP